MVVPGAKIVGKYMRTHFRRVPIAQVNAYAHGLSCTARQRYETSELFSFFDSAPASTKLDENNPNYCLKLLAA